MIGKFDNFQNLFITRGVNTGRVTPHLPLAYPIYGRFVLDTLPVLSVFGIFHKKGSIQGHMMMKRKKYLIKFFVFRFYNKLQQNVKGGHFAANLLLSAPTFVCKRKCYSFIIVFPLKVNRNNLEGVRKVFSALNTWYPEYKHWHQSQNVDGPWNLTNFSGDPPWLPIAW